MFHTSPGSAGSPRARRKLDIHRKVGNRDRNEFLLGFLEQLDSPVALGTWMLYKYRQFDTLVKRSIDPMHYSSVDLFRRDYAAVRLFSKTKDLPTSIDKKSVAIDSARRAENLCRDTNAFVRGVRDGSVRNLFDSEWFAAKQIIARILGPLPNSFGEGGWSPGRSTACYGDSLSVVHKYTGRLDVTWSAQLHALRELRRSPLWGAAALSADAPCSVLRSALNVVEGNVMITVPKSAKTDRVICYEPHINIWLQLRVGRYLKDRLARNGVDLRDQSVNQRRARHGSRHGHLATIDLSMASDTMSRELVFELLPIDWALYLDDLRSKYTLWPDGEVRENEKFSSMGNGFTFELESLIFYALASAVADNISVYGDDIICPTDSAQRVIAVLSSAGFSVNTEKSYITGPFRESCGSDNFCGFDVTPVYLRSLPKTLEDLLKFHNSISDWCHSDIAPSRGFAELLRRIRRSYPHHLGPAYYGDGHYHVNLDEACPIRARNGWEGWYYKTTTKIFRVSILYGDRVSGRFSGRFSWGALCASLGPKRAREMDSTISQTVDRRQVTYRQIKGLAIEWRDIVWY